MLTTGRKFLVGAAASLLAACAALAPRFERPELTVAGVELAAGNLLQQNFLVKFNIRNPNDRSLPVTSLRAELTVAGEHIASGVNNHAFVVPAQGSTQFDMTITANLGLALLKLVQQPDGASAGMTYELTGSARLDLPLLHDLPFNQKGTFAWHGS
jgi:LEA14-like dessication related protein